MTQKFYCPVCGKQDTNYAPVRGETREFLFLTTVAVTVTVEDRGNPVRHQCKSCKNVFYLDMDVDP